jgi:hypothetical protein
MVGEELDDSSTYFLIRHARHLRIVPHEPQTSAMEDNAHAPMTAPQKSAKALGRRLRQIDIHSQPKSLFLCG